MNRRRFLQASAASGAAAVALSEFPTPAIAQGAKRWRLVHAYPKGYPVYGTAPEDLARFITTASDGRLTVEVFGANEIVPAFETADAVESGTVEMGFGTSYFWRGKVPAMQFLTGIPFGLVAQEQNAWFATGGTELAQKAYDELGVKFFLAGNSGTQMGGWFNREITTPEDFSGLKMRMPGMGGEVLTSLGATIVNLPGGELLPAMQSGTIDALEWIGPYLDLAFGFYKVAKFYYYPGWQEPAGINDLMINAAAWDGLTDDLKAIVTAAASMANASVLDQLTGRNPAALASLVDEHGVELRRFSDETLAALADKSGEILGDLASADPLSREILDSILAFRAKALGVTAISEQAVLMARALDYSFPSPQE